MCLPRADTRVRPYEQGTYEPSGDHSGDRGTQRDECR
jgi:hypothetical protein